MWYHVLEYPEFSNILSPNDKCIAVAWPIASELLVNKMWTFGALNSLASCDDAAPRYCCYIIPIALPLPRNGYCATASHDYWGFCYETEVVQMFHAPY